MSEGSSVFVFVSTINFEGAVVAVGVGGSKLYDGEGVSLACEGMTSCVFVSNADCRWCWPLFSVAEVFVVEGEIKESARS